MDMFMDKLAQKLTAQEIIKANTAADTEELNRLKSQVADYNECLIKLQKLIEEGSSRLSNAQTVNGSEINRLVEESISKIRELKQDTADLEQIQKTLTEQLDSMNKTITDRLDAVDKTVSGQLGDVNKELSEKLDTLSEKLSDQSDEKLSEKLDNVEENVHKECVKVYRNVQAVIVEENGKQNTMIEEIAAGVKAFDGKIRMVLGISVAALICALVSAILQILNVLNIHPF